MFDVPIAPIDVFQIAHLLDTLKLREKSEVLIIAKNKNDLNVQIGKRLKRCRNEHSLTQLKMAEIFDITVNSYGLLERGVNGISPDKLLILHSKFNVDLNHLITGTTSISGIADLMANCPVDKQLDLENIVCSAINLCKH